MSLFWDFWCVLFFEPYCKTYSALWRASLLQSPHQKLEKRVSLSTYIWHLFTYVGSHHHPHRSCSHSRHHRVCSSGSWGLACRSCPGTTCPCLHDSPSHWWPSNTGSPLHGVEASLPRLVWRKQAPGKGRKILLSLYLRGIKLVYVSMQNNLLHIYLR